MKRILPILALLLCVGAVSAQNPFEKFGYTPKIGTLSKGKYIEHFDTDSIVQIGSILFNPFTKKITGFVVQETVYSEATLKPEIVSRWLSPDPLSEEFPDKSPYNFVNNNPIIFNDPLGLAPYWVPKVNDDGSVSYIAEAGDSAASLSEQFGIDQNQAELITGTKGTERIAEGTEILGQTVKKITGNEVLQLVLGPTSPQDVLNQFVFASDYSQLNDDGIIDTSKFFENIFGGSVNKWTGAGAQTGAASLEVEGGSIDVQLDLRFFSGEPQFNKEWSNFISADLYAGGQRPDGTMSAKFNNYRQISPVFVRNSNSEIITRNNSDFLKLEKRFDRFKKN